MVWYWKDGWKCLCWEKVQIKMLYNTLKLFWRPITEILRQYLVRPNIIQSVAKWMRPLSYWTNLSWSIRTSPHLWLRRWRFNFLFRIGTKLTKLLTEFSAMIQNISMVSSSKFYKQSVEREFMKMLTCNCVNFMGNWREQNQRTPIFSCQMPNYFPEFVDVILKFLRLQQCLQRRQPLLTPHPLWPWLRSGTRTCCEVASRRLRDITRQLQNWTNPPSRLWVASFPVSSLINSLTLPRNSWTSWRRSREATWTRQRSSTWAPYWDDTPRPMRRRSWPASMTPWTPTSEQWEASPSGPSIWLWWILTSWFSWSGNTSCTPPTIPQLRVKPLLLLWRSHSWFWSPWPRHVLVSRTPSIFSPRQSSCPEISSQQWALSNTFWTTLTPRMPTVIFWWLRFNFIKETSWTHNKV